MDRIYPQDASRALSAVQRRDETSRGVELERRQDLATVGDTVPLVFTRWENNVGGLWLATYLIRLGIRGREISLLYLLSQGRLGAIAADAIYYGGQRWNTLSNVYCQGYEAIPPCVDIVPGGVAWEQTITSTGAGLPGAGGASSISGKSIYSTRFVLRITGECYVTASSSFVNSNGNYPANTAYQGTTWLSMPTYLTNEQREVSRATAACKQAGVPFNSMTTGNDGTRFNETYFYQSDLIFNRKIDVTIYTEVAYRYRAIRVSDGAVVREGSFWVGHGGTTLVVDGLPPAKYNIVIDGLYEERSAQVLTAFTPSGRSGYTVANYMYNSIAAWQHQNGIASLNGSGRRNIAPGLGRLTQRFEVAEVTETLRIDAGVQPDNTASGLFKDLSLLGLKGNVDIVRPPDGPEYFKQVTALIRDGIQVQRLLAADAIGSSNVFSDLVLHLMRKAVREEQIDIEALRRTAAFTAKYGLRFDGVLNTSQNLREWLGAVCPYFLCHVRQANGKMGVVPTLPVDASGALNTGAISPTATFTQADLSGYSRTYKPASDRKPFCTVMVYAEQNTTIPGGTVTVEVRYQGQAAAGPFEQHDLSEFCLQRSHAELAARYILAKRRHVTHGIQFTTAEKGRQLLPGDIIRVQMAALGDSHLYQIDQTEEGPDGMVQIAATHFPVDGQGRSSITLDLTTTPMEVR
jgi:Putative phage tail protein